MHYLGRQTRRNVEKVHHCPQRAKANELLEMELNITDFGLQALSFLICFDTSRQGSVGFWNFAPRISDDLHFKYRRDAH